MTLHLQQLQTEIKMGKYKKENAIITEKIQNKHFMCPKCTPSSVCTTELKSLEAF